MAVNKDGGDEVKQKIALRCNEVKRDHGWLEEIDPSSLDPGY